MALAGNLKEKSIRLFVMKRKNIFVTLVLLCITIASFSQVGFGESVNINDSWKFILKDIPEAKEQTFNDRRWQNVDLPHDWSVKQQLSPTLASCTGYLPGGIGWYRKTINVSQKGESDKIYLYFEGVYNRSEVYLNGHLLGERPNGYVSFMYDATPYLNESGENVIAVRVDHSKSADSRWYTGSGIYRNVWLVHSNPIHIAQWGVYAYPSIENNKKGTLNIEVALSNETKNSEQLQVVNELFDKDGKSVAQKSDRIDVSSNKNRVLSTSLTLRNPDLWSIEEPNLYKLETTILKGKETVDASTTTTGFRNFTFDPDKGFALNGKWMKMKGVCIHHDAGVLGSAVPREVWKRRLQNLKEIGVNAIRTSHNPQAPDLYELLKLIGKDRTVKRFEKFYI